MSNVRFPKLRGLHWDLKLKDEFSNIIQPAATPGFETRLSLDPDPIIHFDLGYEFLRQPGFAGHLDQAEELMNIRGFHRARKGDFDSFLLYAPDVTENPDDGAIVAQVLVPDANNIAPLVVVRAGLGENIYEVAGVNGNPGTAPVIKKDGTALTITTDYSILGPGYALAGATYPGLAVQFVASTVGHTMTADFSWYYRVRFEQGEQEYNKFLTLLYEARTVQLMTTRS
jgi:Conserved hypothetical protein 2217 (DUF2460)